MAKRKFADGGTVTTYGNRIPERMRTAPMEGRTQTTLVETDMKKPVPAEPPKPQMSEVKMAKGGSVRGCGAATKGFGKAMR